MAGVELQVRSWWLRHGGRLLSPESWNHPAAQLHTVLPGREQGCPFHWPAVLLASSVSCVQTFDWIQRLFSALRFFCFSRKADVFLVTGLNAEWHLAPFPQHNGLSPFSPRHCWGLGRAHPVTPWGSAQSLRIPVAGHDRTFQKPGSWCI